MGSCTMAGVRLAHLPAFLEAVHSLIPGLIHSLKQDGGAKSIANFTNYSTCQVEILWAFRIIGVWGFVTGLSSLALIYLSTRENRDGFYSKVLQLFTSYQLAKTLLVMLVAKVTGGISLNSWKLVQQCCAVCHQGNGTASVAPEAPGNATPL